MATQLASWAFAQPIKPSSAKFVLVVMADAANIQTMASHCSVGFLAAATSQDRKTVIAGLQRLAELGYVQDTGERVGRTGQVIVYRLTEPKAATAEKQLRVADLAPVGGEEDGREKRNSSVFPTGETVPNFPGNSTEFPAKQSRISLETVPKTVHGTIKSTKSKKQKKGNGEVTFDEWIESLPGDSDAIPPTDPIYDWASDAGLPDEYLDLAWLAFEDRFTGEAKVYSDWRKAFRNYVKKGWLELWKSSRDGGYYLTTSGEQWRQVRDAREAQAMQEAA